MAPVSFCHRGHHWPRSPRRCAQRSNRPLLLTELNCISCHKSAEASLVVKQAPVLDFAATRTRIGYLRKFLRDPQGVKPGTTMPGLFAGDPARDQKVEALLHFLASTGSL